MKSKWLDNLYQIIHDNPRKIVMFWITLSIICSFWSFQLIDYTFFQFKPPTNYPSSIALNKMNYYFPNKTKVDLGIIVLKKQTNTYNSIINEQTETICNNLKNELLHFDSVKSVSSYYDYRQSNEAFRALKDSYRRKISQRNSKLHNLPRRIYKW